MSEQNDNFVDLAAYSCARAEHKSARGALIKARDVSCNGSRTIAVESNEPDQPTIIIHREGDIISAFEVTCTCGRSTTISLEY
jgi:hypothetical protein